MSEVEQAERVTLTGAETTALRVVSGRGGRASWHSVAQVLSPAEYDGQDIDPVRILSRLERAGLIASTPGNGKLQSYAMTPRGIERLRAEVG